LSYADLEETGEEDVSLEVGVVYVDCPELIVYPVFIHDPLL